WITFPGEIYTPAALRPGLEARGHRYRTRSDTETILHLYEEHGDRCVEKLQGMFAFAIWDRRRRRLLLARDRLGIKPLYWTLTDTELLFASEIKALLAADARRPTFDRAVLPEFLATRYVAGEETFFTGIRKLLPGRTLTWSLDRGVGVRRYWQLPVGLEREPADLARRAREVREGLRAAVASHLMSDVPLGLFLSGGIDSSALAALMAPMATEPIRTFAVGFDEPGANELPWARLAARAAGAEHREVVVSPGEFFEALPRLVWHEDEPIAFTSSVPLYFVSRLAAEHVKVVLTGEGSDELFLGYNRYRVTAWNARLGRTWSALPGGARRAVAAAVPRLPHRARRYAERSFLARGASVRELFYENFAVFPTRMQAALLADPAAPAARDPYAAGLAAYADGAGDALRRMSHADLQTYLVELLMKQDQMSMAASIESRVPFLDHRLVEFVSALPPRMKLRGFRTKWVLREAVRSILPQEILTRRKMGFPVPFGVWMRGSWQNIARDVLLDRRSRERGILDPVAVEQLITAHASGAMEG
ncbi:MAG TPA: asparagine synthase (glutamine-hydrolyzing), partial [Gaiellaceae bacterium]|nr:asparagine synthase (glutamine-hydrolyzing) [Gaiellaceae bacterium]